MRDPRSVTGAELLALFGASAILAAAPGPDTVLTIRSGVHGFSVGLRYALGVAIGVVGWSLFTMLALRVVLAEWPWLLLAVEIAGGLFLLWLGTISARHAMAARRAGQVAPPPRRPTLTGIISSLTNPKTGVIFLAVFPQVLPDEPTGLSLAIVASMPALVLLVWLCGVSAASAALGARVQRHLTSGVVELAGGGLIALMGVIVLISAAL